MSELNLQRHGSTMFALFLGAFVLAALPLIQSDFWFDELVTLFDWGFHADWQRIFRQYPVANNHMLYSLVLWRWLHLLNPNPEQLSESALRLPSLLFVLLALLILYKRGSAILGSARGLFVALMMTASPVLLSFAVQMRGYGLTILLATMATLGALELAAGNDRRGIMMASPALLLLPITIPTNILLNASLTLFVFLAMLLRKQKCWLAWVMFAITAGAGAAVYLPIRDQFMAVLAQTGNFGSPGRLLTHLLIAALAHCGLALVAGYALLRQTPGEREKCPRHLLLLGACCLLPLLVFALAKAPFPRVVLMYLPALSIATSALLPHRLLASGRALLYISFFLVANAVLVHAIRGHVRSQQLLAGSYPQDLLLQYYQGNEVSSVVHLLAQGQLTPPFAILYCDAHIYPAFRHYWMLAGRHPRQLECLSGGQLMPLRYSAAQAAHRPQLIVGYSMRAAGQQYEHELGVPVRLQETLAVPDRALKIMLAFPMISRPPEQEPPREQI